MEPEKSQSTAIEKVKKKKTLTESEFLSSMKVKRENGEVLDVPNDAESNRFAARILSAKARAFIEAQLDFAKSKELSTKEVKDLTEAAHNVVEMSYSAYEGVEADLTKPKNTASGAALAAYGAARAVVDGLANQGGMDNWLEKIDALGKSRSDKKTIDITPK